MRTRLFRHRHLLLAAGLIVLTAVVGSVVLALSFASGPVILQQGTGYVDPAGRFTAPIPTGWENESADQYGKFSKDDATIYLIAVEATEVIVGVDAALAIVAPSFDRSTASVKPSGEAPAVNGVWKENIYEMADGRIYYTDTQIREGFAYLVITTAPNIVSLMHIVNDAHAVIIGVEFAGDDAMVDVITPMPSATLAPLPTTTVTFPALTGAHKVGRTVYAWEDTTRQERYTDDQDDKRFLTVWVWYPAELAANAKLAPYLPAAMSEAVKPILGINAAKVISHAYENTQLSTAQSTYPVLVFSHGNQSNSLFYTAMLEEIASHGYIIFGIDHTYNALLTTLPNGDVIRAKEEATPETAETLAVRVADVRFVLDQLDVLNAGDDTFAGHLDLAQLSLIGHSYGGATVAEACRIDQRCQSVAVLDVPLRGEVAAIGLTQPILLMDSERISCDQNIQESEHLIGQPAPFGIKELCESTNVERTAAAAIAIKTSTAGYHLSIAGTRHGSFSDIPFLLQQQPNLQVNLGGFASIDGERGWRVSSDYLLAFFGQYLRGEASPLLNGVSADYPEVTLLAN